MGKSLPRTVLDATLAGWEGVEVTCACGRSKVTPLVAVGVHGPDLTGFAKRLKCRACGAAPTTVRLHRRLITVDGPKTLTGPIAGLHGRTHPPD